MHKMDTNFDRFEQSTLICALIHYALAVVNPDECIRALDKVCPQPKRPWAELVTEARAKVRGIYDEVDPLLGAETDNLVGSAAQRER